MTHIHIQMIDPEGDHRWWRELAIAFIHVGDAFEIRCFKQDTEAIRLALSYGKQDDDVQSDYEVSIKGMVTKGMLKDVLSFEPCEVHGFTRLTPHFTLVVGRLSSEHHGMEVHLSGLSPQEVERVESIMEPVGDRVSILTYES